MRLFLTILIPFLATQSWASGSYYHCNNGTVFEVGDGYFAVNVKEDGLEIQQYETDFTFDAIDSGIKYSNNTFSLLNLNVDAYSEGTLFQTVINGLLIHSQDNKKMSVAISYDHGPFFSYELNCTKKTN